jgi:predicted metal-binding membrane protein
VTNEARADRRRFRGIAALCFVASAALMVSWCAAMPAHCAMAMPGGWTLSMTWMRMPGQTWLGAAAAFLAMWTLMMVAMMLPSLVPILERYRDAVAGTGAARLGRLTAVVSSAYLLVWTAVGVAVFPLGASLAALAVAQPALARAVPAAIGVVAIAAGALQLTAGRCRPISGRRGATAYGSAFTAPPPAPDSPSCCC